MPPALPASRSSALHKPQRGRGGEAAGPRDVPRGTDGPSPSLEAAAVRSELTMASSQFCRKQNKNVLLVTKGLGPLKQPKAQELPSRLIRGGDLHYKETLCFTKEVLQGLQ